MAWIDEATFEIDTPDGTITCWRGVFTDEGTSPAMEDLRLITAQNVVPPPWGDWDGVVSWAEPMAQKLALTLAEPRFLDEWEDLLPERLHDVGVLVPGSRQRPDDPHTVY